MAKRSTEALVVVSKEIGLEVDVDRTKYMVMSLDQNAGGSHNIKINHKPFERAEQFKYLGTNLTSKIIYRKKLRHLDIQNYKFACFLWV